ncbi:DUF3291 domain-containing protein [Gallaecimonas xiamenensis]|uniref:DUF3291 domain-containing protein n=1 Tax=Gallaecimonas xiamenensis 3-C-1 TaxID=745411 RepID=K2K4F0_9GAMM|nr:DUF3291 domain-containing protein [Gallaecimonas xiamenensis]EKE77819.1 hypothetical protein B3C1_00125 [Gallaecimonas xiamenensis 3-C-1]
MHLAQLNIAKARYSLDAPEIADFVDNLAPINALAEASDGFIWRLKDDSGDATAIEVMGDPDILVNMSVWDSVDALKNFMFRTHHRDFLRRKSEWFHPSAQDTYVLWWVPVGHIPTVEEAMARLEHLRDKGDTAYAFTFKSNFQPGDLVLAQHQAG